MNFKECNFLELEDLANFNKNMDSKSFGDLISALMHVWTNGKEQSEIPISDCIPNSVLSHHFVIDNKILTTGISFDDGCMTETIISPFLKSKYDSLKIKKLDDDLVKEKLKAKKKTKTLKEKVNESTDPARLFLDEGERSLDSFQGWFPLTTFEDDGAAFNLRKDHVAYLNEKFSSYGVDLDSQFILMFDYLKPIYRRKKFAHMNSFILNWVSNFIRSNTNNISVNKETVAVSLIDEFSRLMSSTELK